MNRSVLGRLGLLVGSVAAVATAMFLVQRAVLWPHFLEMDIAEAKRDFRRSVYGLQQETAALDRLCLDWAQWDDTYRFVRGEAPTYEESNLVPETMEEAGLCLFLIADEAGAIVWGRWVGGDGNAGPVPPGVFNTREEVFRRALDGTPVNGFYNARGEMMMLSARAILGSDGGGPPRGVLVMGRRLGQSLVSGLAGGLEVVFRLAPAAEPGHPAGPAVTTTSSELVVRGYLPGVLGTAGVTAVVAVPRRIAALGEHALRNSLFWVVIVTAGGAAMSIVLYLLAARIRFLTEEKNSLGHRLDERERIQAALENAQAEARELANALLTVQETERQRISRDLHDTVGQGLAAAKYRVEALAARLPPEAASAVQGIAEVLQAAVAEVRRICAGLRPPPLDELGIAASLEWLCDQTRSTTPGLHVRSRVAAEDGVGEEAKTAMFRMVQEGLTNVVQHARAREVRVDLFRAGDHLVLELADDGCGMPAAKPEAGGGGRRLGLLGMKERVVQSGGVFDIRSHPGQGTLLRACWVPTPRA